VKRKECSGDHATGRGGLEVVKKRRARNRHESRPRQRSHMRAAGGKVAAEPQPNNAKQRAASFHTVTASAVHPSLLGSFPRSLHGFAVLGTSHYRAFSAAHLRDARITLRPHSVASRWPAQK
jgi:hypothetical protein